MHVATYVMVACIGEVVEKLMAESGKVGLGAMAPENFLLATPLRLLENVGKTF